MATSAFLACFLLFVARAAGSCPSVTCASLSANMCAVQTSPTSYEINANFCDDGYECHLTDFLDWEALALLQTITYSCSPMPLYDSNPVTSDQWTYIQCPARTYKKDWPNEAAILFCDVDSDCVTQDGLYESGSCVCVPRSDAKGVCNPDPNNQVIFGKYWTDCDRTSTRTIVNQQEYMYWTYAWKNWVYTQSDLACMGLFYEMQVYNQLLSNYLAAAEIMVSVLALLSLY